VQSDSSRMPWQTFRLNFLQLFQGMDSAADIAFWNTQMHLILEKVEGKTADTATSHQAAPAGQKACRYQ
jgi:hypothetical protein